jgi:pyruvate/2-oxoacid:ferredoxin oxidoreductase alpha subunit
VESLYLQIEEAFKTVEGIVNHINLQEKRASLESSISRIEQTEDEIAAINMVIGANFAGARAMTATSGGGFSLI